MANDYWATPPEIYEGVCLERSFTVDAAAVGSNALCDRWYGPGGERECALAERWSHYEQYWCNPPYSNPRPFVQRAYEVAQLGGAVTLLLPATTDVAWFHNYVYRCPFARFEFLRGRVKFLGRDGLPGGSPKFGSMIVHFN